jgi:hypothetical protein
MLAPTTGNPTYDEVCAALDRIIASDILRHSPRLAEFLRFVVLTTLRGEDDRIKAYTIAVEALGRGEDFDPQTDPIVRVNARRLRRALELYYAGPGIMDRVVIGLPRGGYVPTFCYGPAEAKMAKSKRARSRWLVGLFRAWHS